MLQENHKPSDPPDRPERVASSLLHHSRDQDFKYKLYCTTSETWDSFNAKWPWDKQLRLLSNVRHLMLLSFKIHFPQVPKFSDWTLSCENISLHLSRFFAIGERSKGVTPDKRVIVFVPISHRFPWSTSLTLNWITSPITWSYIFDILQLLEHGTFCTAHKHEILISELNGIQN